MIFVQWQESGCSRFQHSGGPAKQQLVHSAHGALRNSRGALESLEAAGKHLLAPPRPGGPGHQVPAFLLGLSRVLQDLVPGVLECYSGLLECRCPGPYSQRLL